MRQRTVALRTKEPPVDKQVDDLVAWELLGVLGILNITKGKLHTSNKTETTARRTKNVVRDWEDILISLIPKSIVWYPSCHPYSRQTKILVQITFRKLKDLQLCRISLFNFPMIFTRILGLFVFNLSWYLFFRINSLDLEQP
jgi:hypothetical protein